MLNKYKEFLQSCFSNLEIENYNGGLLVRNYTQLNQMEKKLLKELIPKKFEYVYNNNGLEIWEMF